MHDTSLIRGAGPFVPGQRRGHDPDAVTSPVAPAVTSDEPTTGSRPGAPLLRRLHGWYADRGRRRAQSVRQRVADRLARLGPSWRILDADEVGRRDAMDYLAIGPGGVFTIRVHHHGRTKVRLAGDVIQLGGRRPPYVADARSEAAAVAAALSRATGKNIPVMPVVAFVGTGELEFQGMPRGCIVASYRELDNILSSRGRFLSPRTVEGLYQYTRRPETWLPTAA